MTVGWYINRLRSMSAGEIVHRVGEKQRKRASRGRDEGWQRFHAPGEVPRIAIFHDRLMHAPPALRHAIASAAGDILAGRFHALGQEWPRRDPGALFPAEIWRLDPVTEWLWPGAARYCFDISYRHEKKLGDIKFVWEFNRLQFLQPLAAHLALEDDAAALEAIEAAVESWYAANPPFRGVAWNSGIELALRAISLILVASFCGGRLSPETAVRIRTILAAHAYWLKRFPSRYSSANNHVIAEAAGEYLIARAMPDLADAAATVQGARRVLETEIARQILPDGVPAEQSPTYGAFSLEFALLAALAAREFSLPFDPVIAERSRAFAGFVAAIDMDATPPIGDDDEGRVVTLCRSETDYAALVARAAMSFLGEPAPIASGETQLRDALFGEAAAARPDFSPPFLKTFVDGGYSVVHDRLNGRGVHLVLDHGPLGYLAIAAHGHADALALQLAIDGEPVLVDPGTYLYHSGGKWRDWFRSTRAHNTLTLDNADQSVMAGAFNWSHKANAWLEDSTEGAQWSLSAAHDGYLKRLGAHHRRRVTRAGDELLVHDEIDGARGSPPVEIVYQLAPGLEISRDGAAACVTKDGRRLIDIVFPGEDFEARRGEDRFDGGWVSPAFGIKVPAVRLSWCGPSSTVVTRLVPRSAAMR